MPDPMTPEPHVNVPRSLIENLRLEYPPWRRTPAIRALLSQPAHAHYGQIAEPPSIEDLAPGTTLTGALHEVFSDNRPMRLMVVKRRRHVDVVDPEGCFWLPSDIDPSTIRDVTPPPATPEGEDE